MATTAKLSSKFQITIPAKACKALGLKAGRHLTVVLKADRIELVPLEPIAALRGIFAGKSSEVEREDDRV
jgi:AbrB family looped-hinge helix DNA binding protein